MLPSHTVGGVWRTLTYWVKIIAGAIPLQEGWRDYVAAWKAAGGPEALEGIRTN